MSVIAKIISMIALRQTAVESRAAVQHFLTGLATALVLALLTGMMIGALLFGAHYILYVALLTYTTLLPLHALAITLAVGLVITAGLGTGTVMQLKHLFDSSHEIHHVPQHEQPLTTRAIGIVEAFFEGLTGRSRSRF